MVAYCGHPQGHGNTLGARAVVSKDAPNNFGITIKLMDWKLMNELFLVEVARGLCVDVQSAE